MGARVLITGGSGFIGTNLVEALTEQADVINVDVQPPLRVDHGKYWVNCDIMDGEELRRVVGQVQPDYVVHLAARTDCDENTTVEDGYAVNTEGTENVLDAVARVSSVKKVVVTSTQYVSGPEHTPRHDRDYGPHTVYGASKVVTEEVTWAAGLSTPWTIIRPVNIWGPWHQRYKNEFWRVASRGLYLHPAGPPVFRTYGYVGNVVWQIGQILSAPPDLVNRRVLYVGDAPIDVFDWADAFCRGLRGRGAPRVPRVALRLVGLVGDLITGFGGRFPLTTSRYRNMIQSYQVDIEPTLKLLGMPPFDLGAGVAESVRWLVSDRQNGSEDWVPMDERLVSLPPVPAPDSETGRATTSGQASG